jgi:meso-butanediol dehydrogenase/(S,S)-butanediol dehydrogenase/diacetyl reductase
MLVLGNKIIFLTGGASGIGQACAYAYATAGASVFVMDKDEAALNQLLNEMGDAHAGYVGEVNNQQQVKAAIEAALARFGTIDVIHNNAGIASPSKPLHETTENEWDDLFSINLKSVYWSTRYGIEALKISKGCILNTSSMVGDMGQENHAGYVATKGGMSALTKAMALDYASFGVRVNAVCPAGVWTPMLRTWASQQANPEAIENYLDNIHALGYCPEGDVIADVAVFLVSDAARFVTGCIMPVSGGAELGYKK